MVASGFTPAGLCARCIHAATVETSRGSVFLLCELSRTDLRFPKYPRLPVLHCDGFSGRRTGEITQS
jgi:hypothetical protein